MLSDHERHALREIQRQLVIDDPDFERSFRALETATPPTPRRWVWTVVIVIAALLATIMLLAGSPGGALIVTLVAGSVWLIRHLRSSGGDREPGD